MEYVAEGEYWTLAAGIIPAAATVVTTFSALQSAVLAGQEVQLGANITATANIGTIDTDITIDGGGFTLNMGRYQFLLTGSHKLTATNLELTQVYTASGNNARDGVFSISGGSNSSNYRWTAEFTDLDFTGTALIGTAGSESTSLNRYFSSATFNGKTNILVYGAYGASQALIYARDVTIAGDMTIEDQHLSGSGANHPTYQAYFRSPGTSGGSGYEHNSSVAYGTFLVKAGVEVNLSRSPGNGTDGATSSYYRSLIYGYASFIFEDNSTFNAKAGTNRTTSVSNLYRSAVIRSNNAQAFTVGKDAKVFLETDAYNNRNLDSTGFTGLYLKKQDNLKIDVALGGVLNVSADGRGSAARGQAPVTILGDGTSDTTIQGTLYVHSENGNGWYYDYSTSRAGKNTFTVDGGTVDIIANNGGTLSTDEYAAFEAYGKYDMAITVKNAGKMNVLSNGYRGMSLASSSGYNNKDILVTGEGSELSITGLEWAIAAETQPILSITAEQGGVINLATTGTAADGTISRSGGAPSTVYSVGPTTYTATGAGSEINLYHAGGTYSAIFHDGYGALVIDVLDGAKMTVENHNDGTDTSARRAAITAQSTNLSSYGSYDNQINVDGEGSDLYIINTNPYTHGNGGDTGLYATGAVCFNNTARGSINVSNGGNFTAISSSLAPTIFIYQGTMTFDNPGEFEIRNDSTSSTTGNNNTYNTFGQAVNNERYRSTTPSVDAIKFIDCDVTVWSVKETPYPDTLIDNKWEDVTFSARNGQNSSVGKNGLGGDTNLALNVFALSDYGRINGRGHSEDVDTAYKVIDETTGEAGRARPGDEITYEIYYENAKTTARELVIVDTLPSYLEYVSHSPDDATSKYEVVGGAETVTWDIGTVQPGDSGSVYITVRVTEGINSITPGGDGIVKIVNSAELTWEDGQTEKPEEPEPVGSYKTVAEGSAGENGAMVYAGDTIRYEIVYINNTGDVASVEITDVLPAGVSYVDHSDKGSSTVTGNTIVWEFDNVAAGSIGTVWVEVTVLDTAGDQIENVAGIKWNGGGEDDEDPGITIPVGVSAAKEIVDTTGEADRVRPGDVVTYEISYYNNDKDSARDVEIVDTLPGYLKYVSHTPDDNTSEYTESGGVETVTWNISAVQPETGGSVTITVLVTEDIKDITPDSDGVVRIRNEATLTWGDGQTEKPEDPEPAGSYKTVAEGSAGENGAMVYAGDTIRYEIVYINNTGDVASVEITDVLPAGVSYADHSDKGSSTVTGNTIVWEFDNVPAGSIGTVWVEVTVLDTAGDQIENVAGIKWNGGGEDDEDPGITIPVGVSAAKEIVDTTGEADRVRPGDVVTYEISYYNNDKDNARDVEIVDTLPGYLKYVSHTPDDNTSEYTESGGVETVTWEIGDVQPETGGSVTITVLVTEDIKDISADSDGVVRIRNEATLTWDDGQTEKPEDPEPVGSYKTVAQGSAGENGATVYKGDVIRYEIVYINNTGETASVKIVDEIPNGVTYVRSGGVGVTGTYDAATNTVTWEDANLAPGYVGTVWVEVEVTDEAATEIRNVADITWTYGGGEDKEDPEIVIPVGDRSEKIIVSEAGRDGQKVRPGDEITYRIVYVNRSDSTRSLEIVDELPEALEYVSSEPDGAYTTPGGVETITWSIDDVDPWTGGYVEITVRVTEAVWDIPANDDRIVEIINAATLTWSDGEEEKPETPSPVGSYKVVGADSGAGRDGAPVTVGDEITYEIVYINNTGELASLEIVDYIPEGAEYVTHTDSTANTGTSEYVTTGGYVRWQINNVAAGAKGKVTVTVRVTDDAVDEIRNVANMTWTYGTETEGEDPEAVNPIGSSKRVVPTDGDYTGVDGEPVVPGDVLTYEITYVNRSDTARDLIITDVLEAGLEFISATDGGVFDDTDTVVWNISGVEPGAKGSVTVTVRVTDEVGTVVTNRAHLEWDDGDEEDPYEENPVGSYKLVADDSESGYGGGPVHPGDEITYRIYYINNMGASADVRIEDTIPAGAEYVSASDIPANGSYNQSTDTVVWNFSNLPDGHKGYVTLTVRVLDDAEGEIHNTANITWTSGGEQDEENPDVTNPIGSVKQVASGSIGYGGGNVYVGQEITYQIAYLNIYGEDAELTIVDELPPELEYVTSSPDGEYELDNGVETVTWNIGTVPAGGDGYVEITVRVASTAGATVTNTAKLTWKFGDGTEEEEDPKVVSPVGSRKESYNAANELISGDIVYVGDVITYKITYVNNYDQSADLTITDELPDGVQYMSSSHSGVESGGTVTWNILGVQPGASDTVTVTVMVTMEAEKEILNTANLAWSLEDGSDETEDPQVLNPLGSKKVVAEDSPGYGGSAVTVGDQITYAITYINNTGETADLRIVDNLPLGTQYVSHDPDDATSEYTVVGGVERVTWTISGVAPGEMGTVYLTVEVTNEADEYIVNEAELYWDENYEQPWTENPNIIIPVVEDSKKLVAVSSGAGFDGALVYVGDRITYEIAYVNNTGENASLDIVDTIPEGTKYIRSDGTPNADFTQVTWHFDEVQAGAMGSVYVTVEVLDTVGGTVVNNADLTWSLSTGGSAEEPVDVVNPVGAKKQIVDDEGESLYGKTVKPGDEVTYVVSYHNHKDEARTLSITDALPEGLEYVDSTPPADQVNGNVLTWNLGSVAANTGGTIEITVRVTEAVGNYVTNTAKLEWGDGDTEEPIIVNPVGSRKYVQSGSPGEDGQLVYVGDVITYEISYFNSSDLPRDLTITDMFADGLRFIVASPGGYTEHTDSDGNVTGITWTIADVPANTRGTVTIKVEVTEDVADELYNQASLSWDAGDGSEPDIEEPDVTNPVGSRKVVADGSPGAGGEVVRVGDQITYEISYINHTGETADLVVVDYLPDGVKLVSYSHDGYLVDNTGDTLTWEIKGVAPGDKDTIEVVVEVLDSVGLSVINRANLEWFSNDNGDSLYEENPEVTNPTGSKKTVVSGSAGADGQPVNVGDIITYEIVYTNNSAEPRDVVIQDTLAAGLAFKSAGPPSVGNYGTNYLKVEYDADGVCTVSWTITDVPGYASGRVLLEVEVTAEAEAVIRNEATITWKDGEVEIPDKETPSGSKKYVDPDSAGADGATVHVGDQITYVIEYINNTGEDADVTITDVLVPGLKYVSATDQNGAVITDNYDEATRTVIWEIKDVPGEGDGRVGQVTLTVEVTEDVADVIVNQAGLSWDTGDGSEPDIEEPTVENPVGSRKYVATNSPGENGAKVYPGDIVTYVISYYNSSNVYASPTIVDTLGQGMEFIDSNPAPTSTSGNTVTWALSGIAPGVRQEVYVRVLVTEDVGTEIFNEATVTWSSNYGDGPDDEDIDVTNPVGSYKHVPEGDGQGGASVSPGDEITYEIVYINHTGEQATVTIVDEIPAGVTYVDHTGTAQLTEDADGNVTAVTWTIDDVQPLDKGSVTLTVRVDDDAKDLIANRAGMTWDKNGETLDEEEPSTENPVGQYRVMYHADNGTGETYSVLVALGDRHTVLDNEGAGGTGFTYDGYTFTGWADERGNTVAVGSLISGDGTINLYAQWAEDTYTVIYDANNGSGLTDEYTEHVLDAHVIRGNAFTYPGYIFDGWSRDAQAAAGDPDLLPNGTNAVTGAAGDEITLYAVWQVDDSYTYTVVYNSNNGENDTYPVVEYGLSDHEALPNDPQDDDADYTGFTYPGYKFDGWSETADGGVDYLPGDLVPKVDVGETKELYAVWSVDDDYAYTVVYNANNGTDEHKDEKVYALEAHTVLDNDGSGGTGFTYPGYVFAGWSTEADGQVEYMPGNAVGPYEAGTSFQLYAVWGPDDSYAYNVVYDPNGGEGSPQWMTEYALNDHMAWRNDPLDDQDEAYIGFTYPGYVFAGWSTEPDGEEIYQPGDPVPRVEPYGTLELYAVWVLDDDYVYHVVYDANNGTGETRAFTEHALNDHTALHNDGADGLGFTYTDHAFLGWSLESDAVTADIQPDDTVGRVDAGETLTLYAVWLSTDEPAYQVIYHASNGTGDTRDFTVMAGEPHTVYSATGLGFTRDGYTFLGWSGVENSTDVIYEVGSVIRGEENEQYNLYAVWEQDAPDEQYYTVIYDANNGGGATREYRELVGEPHTVLDSGAVGFTRDGYTFLGWSRSASADTPDVAVGSTVTGQSEGEEITLYAVWQEDAPAEQYYNVRYNANGGSGGSNGLYTYSVVLGTAHTVVSNPNGDFTFTRSGYTFLGWATTAGATTPNAGSTVSGTYAGQTITLYAVWRDDTPAVQYYTVVYDANNGTGATREYSVQVGTAHTVVDNSVTRFTYSGYVFQGWATSGGAAAPNVGSTVSGNANQTITLYAVWAQEDVVTPTYAVTFYWNTSEVMVEVYHRATVTEGATVTRPADPTLDGFAFEGWYLEPDCENRYNFTTPVTGSLSLYANWEPDSGLQDDEPEFKLSPDHFAYLMGYDDHDNILPNSNITRAEVATIFFRVIEDDTREEYWSKSNDYSDVQSSDWHNNAISTVSSMGLFTGYPDGTFLPGNPITRQEFAAVAARFLATTSYDGEDLFPDIADSWAREEINIAARAGWLKGDEEGNFNPTNYITRAEVATIINRMRDCQPQTVDDLLPADDMITWPDNMDTTQWYYIDIQEATNSHLYEEYGDGGETWTELRDNRNWGILQNEDSTPYQLYEGEADWNPKAPGYVEPTE